jgi:hypothetical protein
MKARLRYVRDAGDLANERVVIRVDVATDIGRYLLGDTDVREDGSVVASVGRVFWFPDHKVGAGDFVIVHTKAGETKQGPNKAKTTNHYFYWGLENALWVGKRRGPILFEAPEWMAILARPQAEQGS